MFQKILFASLSIGLLTACQKNPVTGQLEDPLFKAHEIVASAKPQVVLTGFLLGGPVADIAIVHRDEAGKPTLTVYEYRDGSWAPALETELDAELGFVDVARVGDSDRLLTHARGQLNWVDPVSAAEVPLLSFDPILTLPEAAEVRWVDITVDLNGDGLDDLVAPEPDGFRILTQLASGGFAAPVAIGPPAGPDGFANPDGGPLRPWTHSRVHEVDWNLDGRTDLVFWDGDRFVVHRQDENRLFSATADSFTTEVAFDSDRPDWLAAPEEVRHRKYDGGLSGELTGRVLHSLRDVNADGTADLAVFSLKGGSLWKMHSSYEVYFGRSAGGGTAFGPEVGARIDAAGIPFGIEAHDFDDDGQLDVMYTTLKVGILRSVRILFSAVFTGSVSFDYGFYRMEAGLYSSPPDESRRIRVKSHDTPGEETSSFPAVLVGDVDGDRMADLLVSGNGRPLEIFLSRAGSDLFARRVHEVAILTPHDERSTWLKDLNADGRQDVILHQRSETEPDRVTVLLAR